MLSLNTVLQILHVLQSIVLIQQEDMLLQGDNKLHFGLGDSGVVTNECA